MNTAKIISFCGTIPLLGRSLRSMARRYPEGSVTTVKSGCLAGCRWKRSHRHINAYWLGIHELAIQDCLCRELRPGDVFYDIGANAGFFSLLGSKRVGPRGRVLSFEPLPENIDSIRAQLELNRVENCTVVEAAVMDQGGTVEFCRTGDTATAHVRGTGRVAGTGVISVKAVSLDKFCKESPSPHFIKMDIEGAEVLALRGARSLFAGSTPPKMLIEFHSEPLRQEAYSMLEKYGYEFHSIEGSATGRTPAERHVLCVPPHHDA